MPAVAQSFLPVQNFLQFFLVDKENAMIVRVPAVLAPCKFADADSIFAIKLVVKLREDVMLNSLRF